MKKDQAAAKKADNRVNKNETDRLTDPALKRSFKGHKDGVLSTCFNPNLS